MKNDFKEVSEKIYSIFTAMGWTWKNKLVKGKFVEYKPTLRQIKKCMKDLSKSLSEHGSVCVKTGRIVCMNTYGRTEYFIDL